MKRLYIAFVPTAYSFYAKIHFNSLILSVILFTKCDDSKQAYLFMSGSRGTLHDVQADNGLLLTAFQCDYSSTANL